MIGKGRLLFLGAAGLALIAGTAAWAEEEWREYSYPDQRLQIQFPADPSVSQGQYQAISPAGAKVTVPATIYAVTRGGTEYRATVANLAGSAADDPKALEHAADSIRAAGDIRLDTAVSMSNSSCGRFFGIAGEDGSLNYLSLFYNADTRLFYDIRVRQRPEEQAEHGADAIHFQQSLGFLPDPNAKPAPPPVYPESWREYVYADPGFSVRFPAPPAIERGRYRTASGIEVPETSYSVREGDTLYRVTAAKLWETDADGSDALDQAVRLWKAQGRVLADDSVGLMNGQCGREVILAKADGSRSRAHIFFPSSQHRLYFIEIARAGSAVDETDGDRWFESSFAFAKPVDP